MENSDEFIEKLFNNRDDEVSMTMLADRCAKLDHDIGVLTHVYLEKLQKLTDDNKVLCRIVRPVIVVAVGSVTNNYSPDPMAICGSDEDIRKVLKAVEEKING